MKKTKLILLAALALTTTGYADFTPTFVIQSSLPTLSTNCVHSSHFSSCNPAAITIKHFSLNKKSEVMMYSESTLACIAFMHDDMTPGHSHSMTESVDSILPSYGYSCSYEGNNIFSLKTS